MHLGHQVLARQTVQAARQEGLIPCAYTFDVPPASVLGAGKEDILTDIHQKAALLGACGIDTVVYSRFNRHVAQESAEEFFDLLRTRRAHGISSSAFIIISASSPGATRP